MPRANHNHALHTTHRRASATRFATLRPAQTPHPETRASVEQGHWRPVRGGVRSTGLEREARTRVAVGQEAALRETTCETEHTPLATGKGSSYKRSFWTSDGFVCPTWLNACSKRDCFAAGILLALDFLGGMVSLGTTTLCGYDASVLIRNGSGRSHWKFGSD